MADDDHQKTAAILTGLLRSRSTAATFFSMPKLSTASAADLKIWQQIVALLPEIEQAFHDLNLVEQRAGLDEALTQMRAAMEELKALVLEPIAAEQTSSRADTQESSLTTPIESSELNAWHQFVNLLPEFNAAWQALGLNEQQTALDTSLSKLRGVLEDARNYMSSSMLSSRSP